MRLPAFVRSSERFGMEGFCAEGEPGHTAGWSQGSIRREPWLATVFSRRAPPGRTLIRPHRGAVRARAEAELGAEAAVEVRDVAEAAVEGHVEDLRRLQLQPHRRLAQP